MAWIKAETAEGITNSSQLSQDRDQSNTKDKTELSWNILIYYNPNQMKFCQC